MHPFYKRLIKYVIFLIVSWIGLDYFYRNGATALMLKHAIFNVGYLLAALYAAVFILQWFVEAIKKSKKDKIPFLNALVVWKTENDAEAENENRATEIEVPEPLAKPMENGLFWLLAIVGVGAAVILSIYFIYERSIVNVNPY